MNPKSEVRHLLPDSDFVCFLIPALFSKIECENLLGTDVRNSFRNAKSSYPRNYRNNDRHVVDSKELASFLFRKVKPHLPEQITTVSEILAENGSWNLSQLNSRLRFCKYSAQQYFHRHLDGIHYRSATEQSKLTFMIYLNGSEEFEGGRTLFFRSKDSTEIWSSYLPQQGDLIVFDHNVWHEGEELASGEKFVLRSDILYTRNNSESCTRPFHAHLGYIWKILVLDSNTILSGGRDKTIHVWNSTGQLIQSLKGHSHSILCIEKIDSGTFISGSRDGKIVFWKRNKTSSEFYEDGSHKIHSAAVLSLLRLSENHFASSAGDNLIKISLSDGKTIATLEGHSDWVWQLTQMRENEIISCSEDGTIKCWNILDSRCLQTFTEAGPIMCIASQPEGQLLASGNIRGELILRKLDSEFNEVSIETIKAHSGIVRTLLWLNKNLIASGSEDNMIRIWDVNSGKCIKEMQHLNFVQSLAQNESGSLISASYDGTIRVWDITRTS